MYARGPRFRLDAEQIRDNALFVSGLIDLTMGGTGVKTVSAAEHLGAGRFRRQQHAVFTSRTPARPCIAAASTCSSSGRPRRRSWRISTRPTASSSARCRERSDTPLQALQLMNDVQHFEAARALAERMLTEGGADDRRADRVRFTARSWRGVPSAEEIATRRPRHLETHRELLPDRSGGGASRLIHVGESTPSQAWLRTRRLAA